MSSVTVELPKKGTLLTADVETSLETVRVGADSPSGACGLLSGLSPMLTVSVIFTASNACTWSSDAPLLADESTWVSTTGVDSRSGAWGNVSLFAGQFE